MEYNVLYFLLSVVAGGAVVWAIQECRLITLRCRKVDLQADLYEASARIRIVEDVARKMGDTIAQQRDKLVAYVAIAGSQPVGCEDVGHSDFSPSDTWLEKLYNLKDNRS